MNENDAVSTTPGANPGAEIPEPPLKTDKPPRSQKQINASKRNGATGKGPKSLAGKLLSRLNALKHGLRADTVVLPGENHRDFRQRLQDFVADLQPQSGFEMTILTELAVAAWKLDRARRHDAEQLPHEIRTAVTAVDDRHAERTRRTIANFQLDPTHSLCELAETRAGCEWVLQCWDELAAE